MEDDRSVRRGRGSRPPRGGGRGSGGRRRLNPDEGDRGTPSPTTPGSGATGTQFMRTPGFAPRYDLNDPTSLDFLNTTDSQNNVVNQNMYGSGSVSRDIFFSNQQHRASTHTQPPPDAELPPPPPQSTQSQREPHPRTRDGELVKVYIRPVSEA